MNLFYLSPELSLVGVAIVVILLDLVVPNKTILAGVSLAGLSLPLAFSVALWGTNATTFNGMLTVDQFAILFKLLIVAIAALIILASVDYAGRFLAHHGEYYALILLAASGMMLMAATTEFITIYIALELSTLSLCALVCYRRDRPSSEAALKYLLLAVLSSAVLLYGMALIYGFTGTTSLVEIARNIGRNAIVLMGMVLLVAGFGFKIAAVPFQMWVPDVYEGAPTPITAYLSVASKAAGFAVVFRVFFTAFGSLDLAFDWALVFAILAAATMTLGNVAALTQTNIKRMLGYSSIANAGYLMVGLAAASALGRSSVVFFLAGYTLANLGAFIAIIAITNHIQSDRIDDFAGMSRRTPVLAAALAFCLISLIGLPPTVGFIAKVYIFSSAVAVGLTWLVLLAVVNSVISAYYYLRVVKVMYLSEPAEGPFPSSGALKVALAVSSLGVLVVGLLPYPLMRVAEVAAAGLLP
ncbi:MAG: NADH-quinone oxidoreductase subunit N [Chloroflexi bacterium]|nr:NADH-quinone oxidoreductase subunit N [Chloroflexota bacterium]